MEEMSKITPEPSKKIAKRMFTTRELTIISLLGGLTMFLGITGYGFIPLGFMRATILHIPTIIGGLVEGPMVGVFVGLVFGLFSIYQNLVVPTIMSFAFLNPLVSVLPRILIAPFAYVVYNILFVKNEYIKIAVAAFVGSLFNTITILSMIYILYGREYAEKSNIEPNMVLNLLIGVGTSQGLLEALLCTLLVTPIVYMLKHVLKHNK